MKFVAYLRVSTESQAESGNGLAAQLSACRKYAETSGSSFFIEFHDAGVSGGTGLDKRSGLLEAISALEKEDVLLVAKRDRLGRDPIVVAMIESAVQRKKAKIISVAGEGTEADDPSNVLMRRIVDAFAEYERLIIGARTKAAMQAKKEKGELIGAIPYGSKLDTDGRSLLPHSEEQAVICEAIRLRENGFSFRAISRKLANKGKLSRVGKPFSPNAISQMIKNLVNTTET